jgi:hypothetical protein
MGIIAGEEGQHHADPLFAKYGVLKVGICTGSSLDCMPGSSEMVGLPDSQAPMLGRVSDSHRYGTRQPSTDQNFTTCQLTRKFYLSTRKFYPPPHPLTSLLII